MRSCGVVLEIGMGTGYGKKLYLYVDECWVWFASRQWALLLPWTLVLFDTSTVKSAVKHNDRPG